ncbi:MAG: Holliday junction branch migration protein RuvA [bacterium]|nr:Holliday junction branch migration protein RuvA [bacterium]
MIAFLNGAIDSVHTQSLFVDVNGVGYEVWVPSSVISRVTLGATAKIYTYQHVREDDLRLFGFLDLRDLEIFKLLLGVSGIGPKAGLAILSTYSGDDIVSAIDRGDDRLFASVSGIGKKGAAKIVIDLKGKVVGLGSGSISVGVQESFVKTSANDLVDALVSLGYSEREIYVHIKSIDQGKPINEQIKQALILLAK